MAEELTREQKIVVGARLRDHGVDVESIGDTVGMSTSWVSKYCSGVDPEGV
jgi:predicted transcriptional regulator